MVGALVAVRVLVLVIGYCITVNGDTVVANGVWMMVYGNGVPVRGTDSSPDTNGVDDCVVTDDGDIARLVPSDCVASGDVAVAPGADVLDTELVVGGNVVVSGCWLVDGEPVVACIVAVVVAGTVVAAEVVVRKAVALVGKVVDVDVDVDCGDGHTFPE